MPRVSGIVFAFLLALLPLPAGSAGLAKVLGINVTWDIEETKAAFADAGIRESDFKKDAALRSAVTHIVETWLSEVSPNLRQDSIIFEMLDPGEVPPPQCLYYENAVEQREDIALVAVCFYGKERQLLIMPFFREGKVDFVTLAHYLRDEYGEVQQIPGGEIAAGRQPKFIWVIRPWFHGGMIPKKYIFLVEAEKWTPRPPGISAFIAYLDAWKYDEVRKDIESEADAKKAAEEKAKKDARKGL